MCLYFVLFLLSVHIYALVPHGEVVKFYYSVLLECNEFAIAEMNAKLSKLLDIHRRIFVGDTLCDLTMHIHSKLSSIHVHRI